MFGEMGVDTGGNLASKGNTPGKEEINAGGQLVGGLSPVNHRGVHQG